MKALRIHQPGGSEDLVSNLALKPTSVDHHGLAGFERSLAEQRLPGGEARLG